MNEGRQNKPVKISEINDIRLSAGDAFLAMGRFLLDYYERTGGEGSLASICADVQVENDGMSVDPAALSDWVNCVLSVLQEDKN